MLAWYLARREHAEQALPLSNRALQADPNCGECFDTHALVLSKLGRPGEAVQAQRIAIDRMYEHASDDMLAELEARLAQYEAPRELPASRLTWKRRDGRPAGLACLDAVMSMALRVGSGGSESVSYSKEIISPRMAPMKPPIISSGSLFLIFLDSSSSARSC